MATVTIPKILANFETSLSSKISDVASSLTLDRSTDTDGTTLSGTYSLTLDEGTASEEHMVVTLAGSAGTITRRGLSKADAWTEVTASKVEHDRGASVKITNVSQVNLQRLLNGDDTFNSVAWTGVASVAGLTTPTAGETTKAANVAYVNAVSIAGASDAASTTKGIVEIATSAENLAGTVTGGTGASLVATPDLTAKAVQNASWHYAADAEASDAYVIALTPAITAYAAGQSFVFKANTANTGAATLDVNGLGAKDIKKYCNGALGALETNDIIASMPVSVTYDGTRFVMHSTPATSLTSAAAYETQQFFDTTAATGAQATTLVAGTTSDASTLHYHSSHVLPFSLMAWGISDANSATGTCAPGSSDAGSSSTITFANYGAAANTAAVTFLYMPTTLVPYFEDTTNLTAPTSGGIVEIGTDIWRSEAATIYKGSSTVTISGTAPAGDSPLGYDSVNSYLLVQDSSTRVRRYSGIAGTTITYVDAVTLDNAVDTTKGFVYDNTNARYIFVDGSVIRRFNSSGVTIDTVSTGTTVAGVVGLCFINNRVYIMQADTWEDNDATTTDTNYTVNFIPTGMTR